MIIAEIIKISGKDLGDHLDLCIIPELIHNASLVIDDLPCMDNDSVRRGKPTTHVLFGEAVSILVSLALMGLAGSILNKHIESINDLEEIKMGVKFMGKITQMTSIHGLTEGQNMDMNVNIVD